MKKILTWIVEKVADRGLEAVIPVVMTWLSWVIYCPIWGGWWSIIVAVSFGGLAILVVMLYRKYNGPWAIEIQRQLRVAYDEQQGKLRAAAEAEDRKERAATAECERKLAMERQIADLDAFEVAVLKSFATRNTQKMPIDDPVIAGLRAKGILEIVCERGEYVENMEKLNARLMGVVSVTPLAKEALQSTAKGE
jgi:hypothetical protein